MTAMTEPKKRKPVTGRPKSADPKRSIASFRGTDRFAAWFDGLVAHARLPASVLIEHALIEYAKNRGYNDPAPER